MRFAIHDKTDGSGDFREFTADSAESLEAALPPRGMRNMLVALVTPTCHIPLGMSAYGKELWGKAEEATVPPRLTASELARSLDRYVASPIDARYRDEVEEGLKKYGSAAWLRWNRIFGGPGAFYYAPGECVLMALLKGSAIIIDTKDGLVSVRLAGWTGCFD